MAAPIFSNRVIGRREFGPQRQFGGIALEGVNELNSYLQDLGTKGPKLLARALYRKANFIMRDAKRLTPTDTGALKNSGHVEKPDVQGSRVTVEMGFGGVAGAQSRIGKIQGPVLPGKTLTRQGDRDPAGYAIYVHEDLNAKHDDGQAKYLEQPALEHAATLEADIVADLRKDMGFSDIAQAPTEVDDGRDVTE